MNSPLFSISLLLKPNEMNALPDNEKTIRLLKADDGLFFEKVYKHYFAALYAFATRYLDGEEAKEVVQDVMLWLWENRASLIPEMSLKSLLFTMVKNRCLNRVRHEKKKSRTLEAIREKYEPIFDDPDFYLESELFTLFNDVLKRLPESYREAFEMSRFDGMTHKEIADLLNVSRQTVNYRLSKALEILREELKDYMPVLFLLLL